MGLKQWISRFAAGLGLDTVDSTGMETLVQDQDGSHVAQIHAVRDSIIAMQKALLLVGVGSPWFEWDGETLDQFDEKVATSRVSSSVVAVEELAGMNWVTMQTTSLSGGSPTGGNTCIYLPIAATPPTSDYLVTAEFINLTTGSSNAVGAGVAARYDGVGTAYVARWSLRAARQDLNRYNAEVQTSLGPSMADPDLDGTNQGSRLVLMVRGGLGAEVLVTNGGGEVLHVRDTSPIAAIGKAALFNGTSGAAGTTTKNAFRNIRCFSMAA